MKIRDEYQRKRDKIKNDIRGFFRRRLNPLLAWTLIFSMSAGSLVAVAENSQQIIDNAGSFAFSDDFINEILDRYQNGEISEEEMLGFIKRYDKNSPFSYENIKDLKLDSALIDELAERELAESYIENLFGAYTDNEKSELYLWHSEDMQLSIATKSELDKATKSKPSDKADIATRSEIATKSELDKATKSELSDKDRREAADTIDAVASLAHEKLDALTEKLSSSFAVSESSASKDASDNAVEQDMYGNVDRDEASGIGKAEIPDSDMTASLELLGEEADENTLELSGFIKAVSAKRSVKNEWKIESEFNDGEKAKLSLLFSIPKESMSDIRKGKILTYQLPDGVEALDSEKGDIVRDGKTIGQYRITKGGLIKLDINKSFAYAGKSADIALFLTAVLRNNADENKTDISFGEDTDDISVYRTETLTGTDSRGVEVTASYRVGTFPEGTKLHLTPVYDEEALSIVRDAAQNSTQADGKFVSRIYAVDISFVDADGAELEPEGDFVRVSMRTPEKLKADESKIILHVDDERNIEELDNKKETEIAESASGSDAVFDAESFSVYALAVAGTESQSFNLTDLASINVSTSSTTNEAERNATFDMKLNYNFSGDGLKTIQEYIKNNGTSPTLLYDFSETLKKSPLKETIDGSEVELKTGNLVIGKLTLDTEGHSFIKFTNLDWVSTRSTLRGTIDFTVTTSEEKLKDEDKVEFDFPGAQSSVTVDYKKSLSNGTKEVQGHWNNDGSYTLDYTAKIKNNSSIIKKLEFIDAMQGKQTLLDGSVKLNGQPVASVIKDGQSFSFDIAGSNGYVPKGEYTVTYSTIVSKEELDKIKRGGGLTETNTAKWKYNNGEENETPGGDTTHTFIKPPQSVSSSKKSSAGDTASAGQEISYTVTYGDRDTELYGLEIFDDMTDIQTYVAGSMTIKIGDIVYSPSDFPGMIRYRDDGYYSMGSTRLFDYTFSQDEQRKGPVVISYKTRVIDKDTAKKNGIYGDITLSNTASSNRTFTPGKTDTKVPFDKEQDVRVKKTAQSQNGSSSDWKPGDKITYTITIGDENTDLDYVKVSDYMTDMQIMDKSSLRVTVAGRPYTLPENAVKYIDDKSYGGGNVSVLDFQIPKGTGKGPMVITYTTSITDIQTMNKSEIYGTQNISNAVSAGNGYDSTTGKTDFGEYELEKTVTSAAGADINKGTVQPGEKVHYSITVGGDSVLMDNMTVRDEMTDVQKLSGDVTVTLPQPLKNDITLSDGQIIKKGTSSFNMPAASDEWKSDGVKWTKYKDDNKYSQWQNVSVFDYKFPEGTGYGPVRIDYNAEIISADEAANSGINADASANNTVISAGRQSSTELKPAFSNNLKHEPTIEKSLSEWDVENNTIYWNIKIGKTTDSAYPLENITVYETYGGSNYAQSNIVDPTSGDYYVVQNTEFDVKHAVVTTASGKLLQIGRDYTVDTNTASVHFNKLDEEATIRIAYKSPDKYKITSGYVMNNTARVEYDGWHNKISNKEEKYESEKLGITKTGEVDEKSGNIVKWQVIINPLHKAYKDSDPIKVIFEDALPEGHVLLNYNTKSEENPGIHVRYEGSSLWGDMNFSASVDSKTNKINPLDISKTTTYAGTVGLNNQKMVITYYTKITDTEWSNLTSALGGKKTYENHATITAGDNEKFDAKSRVTVKEGEVIKKADTTGEHPNRDKQDIYYSIDINPEAYMLNYGKTLTLTDDLDEKVELVPESIELVDVANSEDNIKDVLHISYESEAKRMVISNIPDSKHLKLSYRVRSLVTGEYSFTNTATLFGGGSHSSTSTETHKVEKTSGNIGGESASLELEKVDAWDARKVLPGAEFKLYTLSLDDKKKIIENSDVEKDEQQTDEKGRASFYFLSENVLYYWVETKNPEGYSGGLGEKHYFVIHYINEDDPDFNNEKHKKDAEDFARLAEEENGIRVEVLTGEASKVVSNVKEGDEFTSITVKKRWMGDLDNFFETRPDTGIELELYQISGDGTETLLSDKTAAISASDAEGKSWPSYTWNMLPQKDENGKPYRYTVKEKHVDGYYPTYSDKGSGIESGEITVTNTLVPANTSISVKKEFDSDIEKLPDQVLVHLMRITVDKTGNHSDAVRTGESVALNSLNDWKHTWENLATGDADGNTYLYTVEEDMEYLLEEGYSFIASYSENAKTGVLEAGPSNPLVITNSKDIEYSLPETGGSGTTRIYLGGSALILLAAVYLFIKRKKEALV